MGLGRTPSILSGAPTTAEGSSAQAAHQVRGARRTSRRGALQRGAALLAAGASGAACGPKKPDGGGETSETQRVTYWHWGTEGDLDRERRTAAQFRERYPNVEVEVVLHGQNFDEQIAAAFSGGAPPDVHALDMQVVQARGKHNVLVDLRAHLKPDKTLSLASFEQAPMAKLALQLMSYREQVLGLPGEAEPNVYVYNADLFRAAGLKTPHELWKEDRWTWEAFTDSVVKLVRRQGDAWRVAGATAGLHRLWMNTAGGKEFDDVKAPKRCLYDDGSSVEGLALAGDLRHRYRVTPLNFNREVGLNETEAFVTGRVAMVAGWTSGLSALKGIGGFKWGMVPYPKKKGYAVDFATSGPAIAKGSKVRAAAWEWLKFRQGPEGQAVRAAEGTAVGFQPEARKVLQEALGAIPSLETPAALVELLEGGRHSFVRLLSAAQAQIHGELINPELNKVWRNEEAAADTARRVAAAVNGFLRTHPQ